jgi:hypothetical protein
MDLFYHVFTAILLVGLLIKNGVLSYKVGYYEQKLKNHKHKFTTEEWSYIEEMLNK